MCDYSKVYECGCQATAEVDDLIYLRGVIVYCPKHAAADAMYEVLDKALQEYMSSHQIYADTLRGMAEALALADGDTHE